MLHEAYEIIHETLCALHSDDPPERRVCREADRFAAAVLMPPEIFSAYALASGLDVVALQGMFQCSYASVAMRLAEVMRRQPLVALLYECKDKGDPSGWPAQVNFESFKATVVKRTPGFGPPSSHLLCGWGGGVPRPGKALPSDSLAELAARSGGAEYAEDDGFAVAAKPVLWKGRIAKVSVVAVPFGDRRVLAHSLVRHRVRTGTSVPGHNEWQPLTGEIKCSDISQERVLSTAPRSANTVSGILPRPSAKGEASRPTTKACATHTCWPWDVRRTTFTPTSGAPAAPLTFSVNATSNGRRAPGAGMTPGLTVPPETWPAPRWPASTSCYPWPQSRAPWRRRFAPWTMTCAPWWPSPTRGASPRGV